MNNLDEKIENPQLEEIDKFIEDIYALRKTSIAAEGEYSVGNLIFKECRNKGYLDNLKELRNKIIGNELSLESLDEDWMPFSISDRDDEETITTVISDKRFTPINNEKQYQSLKNNNIHIITNYLNGIVIEGKVKDIKNLCSECNIMNPLKVYESLEEDFRLFKNKNFDKLLDEGDHGSNKLTLINAINNLQKNYITKSAEKFNIGNKSYNKWKAVLHHINGNRADNKLENLVLILDNTNESPKQAEMAHKLIHLYAAAHNIPGIQNKILDVLSELDSTVEYIMFNGSEIIKFNFNDWWKAAGNILVNCYTEIATDELVNDEMTTDESLELTVDQDLADNRQPIDNNMVELEDEPYDYKKETAKAKGLNFDKLITEELSNTTLQEDNEFGKYKNAFIKNILQLDQAALHKGAESRKIFNRHTGETEEKLLWDSVLHHNDGNHDNNPFDFSNYTLIQCNNYSTAMFIHRLVHLLGFAENGSIAEIIKEKIKSYNPEFITLLDNQLNIQDFDAWWNSTGNIITGFIPEKIANMQPSDKNLVERLGDSQRYNYKDELSKIAFNQAIVQDNGLFHIYNIKESDVDRIVNQIRNLDYIDWVQKSAGRFDFSKVGMPGSLQPRIYEIYGQIKN